MLFLPNGSDPATVMLDTVKVILPSGIRGLLVVAFAGVAVSTASLYAPCLFNHLEQDVFAVLYKGEYNNKTAILVNRIFVGVVGLLSLSFWLSRSAVLPKFLCTATPCMYPVFCCLSLHAPVI